MKKNILIIVLVAIFLLPLVCYAADVTLAWNYSDPNATGYKIFRTQQSGIYDFENPVYIISDINIKEITDSNLADGIYYWVVKAYLSYIPAIGLDPIYIESEQSNEVKCKIKTVLIGKPDNNRIESVNIDAKFE